jgi:hypothetical protein
MKGKTEEKKTGKTPTVLFALKNETPGAVRFQELNKKGEQIEKVDEEGGAIGSLYVRKSFLKSIGVKGVPDRCTVTISFE